VIDAERDADAAERAAIAALMSAPPKRDAEDAGRGAEARVLILGLEIARTLEEATDRLASSCGDVVAQSGVARALSMNGKHLEPVFIGPGGSPGLILAEHVGSSLGRQV